MYIYVRVHIHLDMHICINITTHALRAHACTVMRSGIRRVYAANFGAACSASLTLKSNVTA